MWTYKEKHKAWITGHNFIIHHNDYIKCPDCRTPIGTFKGRDFWIYVHQKTYSKNGRFSPHPHFDFSNRVISYMDFEHQCGCKMILIDDSAQHDNLKFFLKE
jgi:hypothetical protein